MKLSEMQKNEKNNLQDKFANISGARQKKITEAYDELKTCSNDELMSRLAQEIRSQKENGTFDFDGLRNTIERMKIYLPNTTYQNMVRIIENFR